MILKFLLVLAVIGIVYFMFIKPKPIENKTKQNKKDTLEDNDMVACTECGIYVEVSESIISNAKYYCSTTCIDKSK